MDPLATMCADIAARLQTAGIIPDAAKAVGPVDRLRLDVPKTVAVEVFPVAAFEEFEPHGPPISPNAEHSVRVLFTVASERWVPPLFAVAHQARTILLSDHTLWRPANRIPIRCDTGPAGPVGHPSDGERPYRGVPIVLTWREPTDYSVDHPDLAGITVTAGVPPTPTRFTFTFDFLEA